MMQQLFSVDMSLNQAEDFLSVDRRPQKLKMGIRRALIFVILVVAVACIYCFYSLYFQPHPDDYQLLLSDIQDKPFRIPSNAHQKYSDSLSSSHLQQLHPEEANTDQQRSNFGFPLFPKGIEKKNPENEETETVADEGYEHTDEQKETCQHDNDESASAANLLPTDSVDRQKASTAVVTDSDLGSSEWQKRFEQQQTRLLQLLQDRLALQSQQEQAQNPEQNELPEEQQPDQHGQQHVPDQPLSGISDSTAMPTTVQTQILKRSTTSHNQQQGSLPVNEKTSNNVADGDFFLDQVETVNGAIKGWFKGLVFNRKSEPGQLFVKGIQPRKDIKPTQAEMVKQNPASEDKPVLEAATKETGLNTHQPVSTQLSQRNISDIFEHQLENKMEKVIDKDHNNELLKERFKQVKKDFDRAETGFKPKVDLQNDTQSTPPVQDREQNENKVHEGPSRQNDKPARAKPAVNVAVSVYNLSQPVKIDRFLCSVPRISVYSRTICTDPESSPQPIFKGSPEEKELKDFQEALSSREDLGAVDLGAGLGMYTVAAATLGRPVLALEPYQPNVRLFHKTMELNRFTHTVTLVTNALGERLGVGKFRHSNTHGRTEEIFDDNLDPTEAEGNSSDLVRIVRLDDLLPLMTFSHAVLKLHVPAGAHKVLKGGRRFLRDIDVRFVFLYWPYSTSALQCIETAAHLRKYGMEPAPAVKGDVVYSDEDLRKDHYYVVWRKMEK